MKINADGEIPALRTAFSDTYAVGDGTYRSVFSPSQINVKQSDGSLVPLTSATTPLSTALPALATGSVDLNYGAATIGQTLLGAAPVPGLPDRTATAYGDALPATDVTYTTTDLGIDEALSLRSAAAPKSFSWALRVGPGESVVLDGDKSLALKDGAGAVVGRASAPWMRDAAGEQTNDIAVSLTGSTPAYTLTYTPPAAWLADNARSFPITLDPSWNFGGGTSYACEFTNPTAGTHGSGALNPQTTCDQPGGTDHDLAFGDDKYARRTFIRFPDVTGSSSPVPADAVVTAATLDVVEKTQLNSTSIDAQVYSPTSSTWNSSSTWSTLKDGSGDIDKPYTEMDDISSFSPPGANQLLAFNAAPAVRDWVDGNKNVQTGLEIRVNGNLTNTSDPQESDLSNLITLYGLANATTSNRPHLVVYWQNQVGTQGWIGKYSHRLSDKMTLSVDYADRDLVLANTDDTISSPGRTLGVQRTYNSLNAAAGLNGAFGPGWTLNGGADVYLTWDHANVYITERDGAVGYFSRNFKQSSMTKKQSDNDANGPSYNASPGLNADLVMSSSTQFKIYFRKQHTIWTFTLPTSSSATGYLSSVSDYAGNAVTFSASGTPLQTTSATDSTGQRSVNLNYTGSVVTGMSESLVSGATGARSWSYSYTSGSLSSYTNAAGKSTTYCYTSGLLTKIITPHGVAAGGTCSTTQGTDITDITYDASGHVTSVSYENGTNPAITVGFAVGVALPPGGTGGTVTETDPYSKVMTVHFDTSDRTTQIDTPLGYHRSAKYNTNNDVTASVSANNFTGGGSDPSTTFGYDESGSGSSFDNPTSVTQPSGTKAGSATYDETGSTGSDPYEPTGSTNDEGNKTAYKYDADGQVTTATLGDGGSNPPDSSVTLYYDQYNAGGHCGPSGAAAFKGALCEARDADYNVSISTAEHRTLYNYDSLGELASKTTAQPDHGRSTPSAYSYTYDSHSRLASMTDPTGTTFNYSYDALDRLTQKNDTTDGVYTTYTYDEDGDATDIHDYYSGGVTVSGNGHDETRGYDNLNRLTSEAQSGKRTINVTWDADSRMATYSDGNGGTTSYSYDDDGRLASMALWGGSCTGFNATTNLPTVASNCITFAIDADGNRTKAYFPGTNVAETWTYDKDDKITEVVGTGTTAGSNHTMFDYTYDYTGNMSNPSDHLQVRRNPVTGEREEYGYDSHGRLYYDDTYNSLTLGTGTKTARVTYCFDKANNLIDYTTTTATTCSRTSPTRSFDGANEVLGTNHSFNAAGSETSGVSNLPSAGAVRTTTWGAGQQPLNLAINGGSTKNQDFLDFTNNTLLYSDTSGGDSDLLDTGPLGIDAYDYYHGGSVVNTYSYARDPQGNVLAMRDLNGYEEFALTDNQGSVLDLLYTDGSVIDSYHYTAAGQRIIGTNTIPQPLGYLGAYTNYSTGLIHLGARFYDPSLLAFTQTDPQTHNSDPGQDNPYTYAGADPLNRSDPSGENVFDDITSDISTAADAVAGVASFVPGVGDAVAGVATGVSFAAQGAKLVGDSVGWGDDNVAGDVASTIVGGTTAGVSGLAKDAGASAIQHSSDAVGLASDAGGYAGLYG